MEYLGKPWEAGATGPDAFDCWGLVRHWYSTKLGVDLPVHLVDASDVLAVAHQLKREQISGDWVELEDLEDNCVVAMGHSSSITHVGVCIGDSYILHASRQCGYCVVQTLSQIRRSWVTIRYYKPHDQDSKI